MTTPVVTATKEFPIEDVAKLMFDNRIGSVVIVNDEGKIEGIVTERDMIYAIAKNKVGRGIPVYTIMTENPITIDPDKPLIDAVRKMREAKIRHLPVVRDGVPVGMVSLRDIIEVMTYLASGGEHLGR